MKQKLVHKHPRWLHSKPEDFQGDASVTRVSEIPDFGVPHVVTVDGKLRPELGQDIPGVRVISLQEKDDVIEAHLNAALDDDEVAKVQSNFFDGGVLIDAKADATVHLVHLTDGAALDRVLVHARDNVKLTLIQHFIGKGVTNAVTELQAHDGATIQRDVLQASDRILHSTFTTSGRDATVSDVYLDLSGTQRRNTLVARLDGRGAHVALHGLYLATGNERSDHWTRVDHAVPDTTSNELYKGILGGSGRGSFTGNVLVRKDAQRTNALQENRNLLLSRKALAESTPQLEIFADDVQCGHGSTVGALDEKALFFLQARGIGRTEAEFMLTKAFAGEVIDAIHVPAVREHVTARIETWFSEAN